MATTVQVTFDCTDPHRLADWWADLLEWSVEFQDPAFIRRMIDEGHATPDETLEHNGHLVWRAGAAIMPPENVRAPRILFVQVPEGKAVKNRVHLDLRPDSLDLEAARARAVERGAVPVGDGRQGPHSWVVFTDPEGNEFCL
jgi:hypothetical protein